MSAKTCSEEKLVRKWTVRQGRSTAVIVAPDWKAAKERAAQIGFTNPDTIVLKTVRA